MSGNATRWAPLAKDAPGAGQARPSTSPVRQGPPASQPRGVLHVVGDLNEAVWQILGPACAALRREGRHQAILVLDGDRARQLLQGLDPSIPVHYLQPGKMPAQSWFRMGRSLQTLVGQACWEAVHLHGLLPMIVGLPLARRIEADGGRMFVTPHSSRSLRSLGWFGRPMLRAVLSVLPGHRLHTLAHVPFDVRAMQRLAHVKARLIEPPVEEVFFSVHAQVEPRPPVIVGGAADDAPDAVQRFAQLSILLAGVMPELRYRWLSPTTADERALLGASGIETLEDPTDRYARARALANASLYVAPQAGRGFEMLLAEAMAVGLPCVGYRSQVIEDMLTDGETGVLAGSMNHLAQATASLLRDAALRSLIAEQARTEAMLRFSDEGFHRHLLAAFSRSPA